MGLQEVRIFLIRCEVLHGLRVQWFRGYEVSCALVVFGEV